MPCKRKNLEAVAALAKCSASSVSRALSGSGYVSEKLRAKIRAAADKCGYRRNEPLSRAMSAVRTSRPNIETVAFVNTKSVRDVSKSYSAIARYVAAAKRQAERLGLNVCDIWLGEKNFTPSKFEKIMSARGIRGGIIFGHYYKNSIPEGFKKIIGKFKFVSMGVRANAPVEKSVYMDRFLITRGFTERIIRAGYSRVGFVVERFADTYENGKFSGGFLRAQLARKNAHLIPPLFFGRDEKGNLKRLAEYINRYSPDAVFSYSTDISDTIESADLRPSKKPKFFHYDERYFSPETGAIKNQSEVGKLAVLTLAEILRGYAAPVAETAIEPKWK